MDSTAAYSCFAGFIGFSFDELTIADNAPSISVTPNSTPPGAMGGSFSTATDFSVDVALLGVCDEHFQIDGTFTGTDTLSATLTYWYVEPIPGGCFDCVGGTISFTASR